MADIKKLTDDAIEYIRNLFSDNSDGHDFDHSMRVYANAVRIAGHHEDSDILIVSMAALLHDADDYKNFDTKNNENARRFLCSESLPEDKINRICEVINSVSFSKNKGKIPSSVEGKIVQDADRLDAVGAVGIARTFAYGGKHGRTISDSVNHFHEKLLTLRDKMNTAEGKAEAERRHEYLKCFLEELGTETEWSEHNNVQEADFEH